MNAKIRALRTAIAIVASSAAWSAQAASAVALDGNSQVPSGEENVPTLLGAMARCRCQGNGKVAECEGTTCTCSYDWRGDPECTAGDDHARVLKVLVGTSDGRPVPA